MNTEITDIRNQAGCVCFDGECNLCANLARRFGPLLHRHRFALEPLQTLWVRERLAKSDEELVSEMRLLTPQGQIHGGIDPLDEIARHIWWAKPVYWLSRVPLVRWAAGRAYQWVARKRNCFGGRCSVAAHPNRPGVSALAWAFALLPTAVAVSLETTLPSWLCMWVMAVALFFGAKWVTILRFFRSGERAGPRRLLAYALLWPGMNARAFCGTGPVLLPKSREWAVAVAKTISGATIVWAGVPCIGATHPLITGWVGMVGIVLFVHFGLFHLLSLQWRAFGINARPIMQSPLAATSLSRFWGGSWNTAFTDLMHENLFKPLTRQTGPRRALFLVFLVSGAMHELVISLPAHGGYGLPTVYFLIQGLGLLFERSKPGRRLGIGFGLKGWCFVVLVGGMPAFWLFPPVFIHNVILPMLRVTGAT